ncbi:hypothetical protein [Streptomyces sp. IBSBF 2435]|uniref:hypothetical protein n=1 Tax=Streptomyces sp. IBSBF 2435 TaxID=2903531 RepID=UPI002FDC1F93
MIVVEGARGSGKTMLLGAVREWLADLAPHAHVNFARFDSSVGAPEVLSALAFQLNRRYPVYGTLGFPRLLVGIEVLQQELDPNHRERARDAVINTLRQARDLETLQTALKNMGGAAIDVVQSSTGLPIVNAVSWLPDWASKAAVRQLVKGQRSRRILLGDYQDWYGHRGRHLRQDSVDVLIDLHQWHANPNVDDNRRKVAQLLSDAFVTDVVEGFHSARRTSELSLNCLVTLDDADTELGVRFTSDLAEALRGANERVQSDPIPLTVVAASHGRLLSAADELIEVDPHGSWSPPEAGPLAPWLRLRLADFSTQEVGSTLTDRIHRQGNDAQLKMMLMQLTGGHPASVQLLIRALAHDPILWREPARLLERPSPELAREPIGVGAASGSHTLARELIRVLLGSIPESNEHLTDLMICAAATSRQDALTFITDNEPLLVGGQARFDADIDPVLWPTVPSASSELLRRLLLRGLALSESGLLPMVSGLPDTSPTSTRWSVAFSRLQQLGGDDELYYTLALGDLAEVTRQLDALVGSEPSALWLERLARVTAAPRRPGRPTTAPGTPLEEMRALAGSTTAASQAPGPLADLVAACWITADPFVGNQRHSLHLHIAQELKTLARRWPQDSDPLYQAARRYESQAIHWA